MKASSNNKNKGPSKAALKFAEDWVPVQSITNGVIVLDNRTKVTGVKIQPRNIFILDADAQSAVLGALRTFYDVVDFEFWIICADRPVDISLYVSQLQLLYNSTQQQAIRKLIMQDINKANMFINNNVVDTEYYILFQENNDEVIQKRIRLIINNLASCGLIASQTTNDDLRIILDNFLNGRNTTEFGTVLPL